MSNEHNNPPVTCGNGCNCLAQCGDTYAHAGLSKPPETEKVATATAVPQGWRFKRNEDDSIGIFAPPPKPGESQRTSHAVYPGQNRDLHELLGKLADQQAATPDHAPAQESAITGEADVWHEGSKSFYRATLLHKLTPEEVFSGPPELDAYTQPAQEARLTDALRKADEFNRYFTSGNNVDVPARISVLRDEWRDLYAALRAKERA